MAVDSVVVREVGLRDGLQSVAAFLPTEQKLQWCRLEHASGVPEIEVSSFVPPKLLAQFKDAAEVVSQACRLPGLTASALVPNLKGAQRAIEAGAHKLNYVLSVSEAHNQANVRRSVSDSVEDFGRIIAARDAADADTRPVVVAGLATAFGCTIEGAVAESRVTELAVQLAELGADELVIADTVGYGNPQAVRRIFSSLRRALPEMPLAAHFHDTRGLGLANVYAALEEDVRRFDASLGGLGGCPYAPGATGNIVMEDLVFMCEAMGMDTGVDIDKLLDVRSYLADVLPEEQLLGDLAKAGLPKNFHR